jgi:hypothetical protein
VRAQTRPDHPDGAGTARDAPAGSAKPVGSSLELPAFDWMPGHTVAAHLFTNVNVVVVSSLASSHHLLGEFRQPVTKIKQHDTSTFFNDDRIVTSERCADQNKNYEANSCCNSHGLEAMQLYVVAGNDDWHGQEGKRCIMSTQYR